MKFIVDAQLLYSLALMLRERGFDIVHTDDLPAKEKTTDKEILFIAEAEGRVVITKDSDFFESYIINKTPSRLLLISTGNIINQDLLLLFENYFDLIIKYFATHNFLELTNKELYAHE